MHAAALLLTFLVLWSAYRVLEQSCRRFAGDFLYPYLSISQGVSQNVSDLSLLGLNRRELALKLESLLKENRRLAAQSSVAGELLVQNEMLRRMNRLKLSPAWIYIPAEIILRDPLFWNETVTVNKGSADGVAAGNAAVAVTGDGRLVLVGVVRDCGKHTSGIQTVHHPDLKISLSFPLSDATGILNHGSRAGMEDGAIPVGFLPTGRKYVPDEAAVTSGFEQKIPSGIKVGNMAVPENSGNVFSDRLFLTGKLKPAAEMNRIRFLIIISGGSGDDGGGDGGGDGSGGK